MTRLEELEQENAELKRMYEESSEQNRRLIYWLEETNKRSDALRQENADLWEYIKASRKLAEETRQTNVSRYGKKYKVCVCGCGRLLVQPLTGGKRKFASEACRKRYDRKKKKEAQNEKVLRSLKRRRNVRNAEESLTDRGDSKPSGTSGT